MNEIAAPTFWVALSQIFMIDLVLSGDNAVVIALACRNLPPQQRRVGILGGVVGAVVARVLLTVFAATLLRLPWIKLVGAVLLLWIGVKLIAERAGSHHEIRSHERLWSAIRTIITADVVMSLDNVVGVAAAARGSVTLLILGLLISIPIVVFGSEFVMRLLHKVPVLITLGGGLLGYIAGGMAVSDPVLGGEVIPTGPLHVLASIGGFMAVVALGLLLRPPHPAGKHG